MWREVFRCRWRWSLGLGVVLAVFLVFNVFNTEDATTRPHGAYFVFELLWRGVGYGLVDTLLLTVFALLVAYRLLHGHVGGVKGKLRFTALMLPLVIIVTATYHLGYPQYRRGRPRSPRDREHPDLDPDVDHRKPRRLDRCARLAARRSRDACLRVEDLRPTGDEDMTRTVESRSKGETAARSSSAARTDRAGRVRLPLPLYQRGWGWLLGRTFLLVTHAGRKTGKRRETVR